MLDSLRLRCCAKCRKIVSLLLYSAFIFWQVCQHIIHNTMYKRFSYSVHAVSCLIGSSKNMHYCILSHVQALNVHLYIMYDTRFSQPKPWTDSRGAFSDLWLEYIEFGYCNKHLSASFQCFFVCCINTGAVGEQAVTGQMMDDIAISPELSDLWHWWQISNETRNQLIRRILYSS
jgi:hypothetical protein